MVSDIRIGDGQHHPCRSLEASIIAPAVNDVLKVDDVGIAFGGVLGVHAVIRGQYQHGAQGIELVEIAVHHGVKIVRFVAARGVLVLHVIGSRQVHQVGALLLDQLHPGGEDELAQVGGIDLGDGQADVLVRMVDAVVGLGGLVRLFRRETDRAAGRKIEPVAEQRRQLVLGGDHGDLGAGIEEGLINGAGAHELGVSHHHVLAAVAVEEEVGADAVDRRRHAGDDGDVVGVGEAGDHAIATQVAARFQGLG